MNLLSVLLTGLLAGGLSCAAVQGGLLAGLLSRQAATSAATRARAAVSGKPAGPGRRQHDTPPGTDTSLAARLGDDLAPIAGFLTGKLASHVVLGALLGALGSTFALSLHLRIMAQLAAGVLIIVMGLAQLGVPGFRGLVIQPPASWSRLVRARARSQSALAPATLGFATVLIPCGVTLSVMALAMTSGSALAGAATMGVFVAGTAPLFAVLGYATRRAAAATGPWRQRLAVATGVVIVALGLYTFNGGLEASGSPVAASQLAQAVGLGPAPAKPTDVPAGASPVSMADGRQTVVITARKGEYTPANLTVKAGIPTTLIVRSAKAQGCVRAFVIPSLGKQQILPSNGDTRIDLGTLPPGELRYSCGMGMYTGQLTATESGQ